MICMTHKEMYAVTSKSMIPVDILLSIVASYDDAEKVILTAEIIE